MDRRLPVTLALVVVVLLAGCSVGYSPQMGEGTPHTGSEELGVYDGYRYDQDVDVNATDGLDDAEQRAVVSRAMARIQYLRGLRFDERVQVEVVSRQEFREEFGNVTSPDAAPGVRALDNAQFQALFLVGLGRDVAEVRGGNRGDVVLGFYDPRQQQIVIVSRNDPATLADEITLAHELVHALQDQRFGLANERRRTLDDTNARNGLVEGDAVVVEQAYERRCQSGEWSCVEVAGGQPSQPPSENFHLGLYFVEYFPYAEGPRFVRHHRDSGGWETVNDMYDAKPDDAAEVIHPSTYGNDVYGEAVVADRNGATWERVRTDEGPDHASVGQSGLASMFAYTAFEGDRQGVVDRDAFRNLGADGRLDRDRPFSYDLAYADGWAADRLHAYRRDDGALAYVWNVTFRDEANASEFREGYRRVFQYWDGERLQDRGRATVWRFDDDPEPFRGAMWVRQDGASVTVVRAPTVDDLGAVYAPAGRSGANA